MMGDIYSELSQLCFMFVENAGNKDYSGNLYIRVFDPLSKEQVYEYTLDIKLGSGEMTCFRHRCSYDLLPGEYSLCCYDMFDNPCSEELLINIKDNSVLPELYVNELSPMYEVCSGEFTKFLISLQNDGDVDYNGYMCIKTFDPDNNTLNELFEIIELEAQNNVNLELNHTLDLAPGEYYQRCYDMFDNPCSEVFTIQIKTLVSTKKS